MVSLSNLIQILTEKKYIFQVTIPGSPICFGKKTIEEALLDAPSLQEFFTRIAQRNKAHQLIVKCFTKNGSSYKSKESHILLFDQSFTVVAPATTSVASATTFVANNTQTATNVATTATNHSGDLRGMYDEVKTYNAVSTDAIRIEMTYLKRDLEETKRREKKLEQEVEELRITNRKLLTETEISKQRHEIDLKEKMLEKDAEKSQGLNGVVESLANIPPEAYQFIAGLFPNHAMNRQLQQGGAQGMEGVNDSNRFMLTNIQNTLSHQPEEVVGMVQGLIEKFVQSPANLAKVYEKFFPQQSQTI